MSEKRLIDADALRTNINNVPMHGDHRVFYDIMSELVSVVAAAPTIDPERHARWYPIPNDYGHLYAGQCSNCGCEPPHGFGRGPWNYCPSCGARMDGGDPHA